MWTPGPTADFRRLRERSSRCTRVLPGPNSRPWRRVPGWHPSSCGPDRELAPMPIDDSLWGCLTGRNVGAEDPDADALRNPNGMVDEAVDPAVARPRTL